MGRTISSGGAYDVSAGQTDTGNVILYGGVEFVRAGGTDIAATIEGGGVMEVNPGGVAIDTIINGDSSLGHQYVNGGKTSGVKVNSGGMQCVYYPGAESFSTTVSGGGYQEVFEGGTASGSIVRGVQNLYTESGAAGLAVSTTISGGGTQNIGLIGSGSIARDTVVSVVSSGGVEYDGVENVYSGGTATSTTLIGGSEYVASGGTATWTLISSGGVLQLDDGATDSSGEIVFSGTTSSGLVNISAGTLIIDGTDMPEAPISGFSLGDDIDLQTVNPTSPISATYSDGVLTLAGIGDLTLSVTDADNGRTDPIPTIGLKPDEYNGGTDIETTPLKALLDLSFDTYSETNPTSGAPVTSAAAADGYTIIASTSDQQFEAVAYEEGQGTDDPNIIIAFRGTYLNNIQSKIKNILADYSFLEGKPNAILQRYVSDAAEFVQDIALSTQSEDPLITLTGHSLGGALAQLVGEASGFATAAFDAPGAGQLYSSLTSELKPAVGLGKGGTNINYRISGDLVSMAGTQIGKLYTIASPYQSQDVFTNAMNNHGVGQGGYTTAFGNLQSSQAISSGLAQPNDVADAQSALQTSSGGAELSFVLNVAAGAAIALDPVAGTGFTFTENAGSPDLASIELPFEPGVADYEFSDETGTSWSAFEPVLPGVDLTLPSGVDGVQFDPVDSSGNPVIMSDGFALTATFVSGGTVSSTLTVSGAQPLAQPVTSGAILTVSPNSAATAIAIPSPTDAAYSADELAVSVTSLPLNGTVFQADGLTPVTVGEELTTTQLTSLTFAPTTGLSADSSVFTYDVADPDFASTTGSVTLAIAGAGPGPVVDSLSAVTDSGATTIDAGHVVTITMDTSAPVTVTGTPQLQLNDGEEAAYTSGTGTDALTFAYTVKSGDRASDLGVTGLQLTSGAEIQSGGNDLSTVLTADFGIAVDTAAPTVATVSAAAGTRTNKVTTGDTVTITVGFSEAVIIHGMPTLQLNDGGVADFSGGSGTAALTFTYTVEPGDSSTDLHVIGLNLPLDAAIQDFAGNNLTGNVSGDLGIQIEANLSAPPVSAGQTLVVSSGRTSDDIVLAGWGTLEVLSGGTASGTTISSGGTLDVESGGTAIASQLLAGGTASIGGTLAAITVSSGALLQAASGGRLSDTTVLSGGTLLVLSGGLADPTVVSGGGTEIVSSGGTDNGARISGGTQLDYGLASGATIFSGGTQVVEAAGTASNTTISSGGTEIVSSGGTASTTTISKGGVLDVLSAGLADPTKILGGGTEMVSADGTDNGAQISGGTQNVHGSASGAIIYSGGSQAVEAGGTASGSVVSSGGRLDLLSGGIVTGDNMKAGGILEIGSGGSLSASSVGSGGTEMVLSAGTGVSATLGSGGALIVLNGGAAIDTTVDGGGTLVVSSGGILDVQVGATDSGTLVNSGTITVADRATLTLGASITNAGSINIQDSLVATLLIETASGGDVKLSGGGSVSLSAGGDHISIGSGVTLTNVNNIISGGGSISGAGTLINSGTINANTSVTNLDIVSLVINGGTMEGTSGGALYIEGGGTNSATLEATRGGYLAFESNFANSKTIEALGSGTLQLFGGTVSNTNSGVILASGGNATIVLESTIAGGTLKTLAGGQIQAQAPAALSGVAIAANSLVAVTNGASLTLSGGTNGAGATVETLSGGTAIVSGAVSNSGTLFASGSGGLVEIASGAVISGGVAEVGNGIVDIQGASSESVTFKSGGSGGLQLDDPTAYTGKVSGFGVNAGGTAHADSNQYIDLSSVTFNGNVSSSYSGNTSSGTLTITSSGATVATLKMVGSYVFSDFHLSSGSGGVGTVITDPSDAAAAPASPVHSANVALFGNYMAASLVTAADGHGGTVITEAAQAANQQLLSHPHP